MKEHACINQDKEYDHSFDHDFDIWYTTVNKKLKKHKVIIAIKDLKKWCKLNKGKVIVTAGSWEVFEIMDSI